MKISVNPNGYIELKAESMSDAVKLGTIAEKVGARPSCYENSHTVEFPLESLLKALFK